MQCTETAQVHVLVRHQIVQDELSKSHCALWSCLRESHFARYKPTRLRSKRQKAHFASFSCNGGLIWVSSAKLDEVKALPIMQPEFNNNIGTLAPESFRISQRTLHSSANFRSKRLVVISVKEIFSRFKKNTYLPFDGRCWNLYGSWSTTSSRYRPAEFEHSDRISVSYHGPPGSMRIALSI